MKKVLVTGAQGFCGEHLCHFLDRKGYEVTGTYHKSRPRAGQKEISFAPLDITSFDQAVSLIQTLKPDAVFHLAAMSVPRLSWQLETETFGINTAGTIYLLEALRKFSPKTKFLFASSIQVYGRTFRKNKPVREEDLLWPESPYAASKAAAELACLDYYHRFGIPVIIARAFNHLGRGQSLQFVFSEWCQQIVLVEKGKKEPVLEVGNLDSYRDFLHVLDVAKAYELLIRKGKPGTVYNICFGKTHVLKDYSDFLKRKAKVPMKVKSEKNRFRKYDPPVMSGDASRLKALGWKPELSPFKALEELLDEWRSKNGR